MPVKNRQGILDKNSSNFRRGKRKTMKPRFVPFIIAFGLLILLAACQSQTVAPAVSQPTNAAAATQPAAPTSQSTPSSEEGRALAAHAMYALSTRPNRMDVTTTSGGNTSSNAIEFIPPDRKHIIGDPVEFIIIGDKAYDTIAGKGKWSVSQYPASTFMGNPNATESSFAADINNASFLRTDELNGKPVIVISFDGIDHFNGLDMPRKTELWIGKADGLPYKMIIDGEIAAVSADPATGKSTLEAVKSFSTTLISFDAAIQIEAPIP
jgi:hypothetical protein